MPAMTPESLRFIEASRTLVITPMDLRILQASLVLDNILLEHCHFCSVICVFLLLHLCIVL
jgi:hypothetical protein